MRYLLFVALYLLTFSLKAQDSISVFKIGYIDRNLFIQTMPETREALQKLDRLKAEYESEFNLMSENYNEKVRVYLETKDSLPEALKLARQTEITELEYTIDLYKRRYLSELEKTKELLMSPIYNSVDEAIRNVANILNLTIVFDQGTPLYMSDCCVDITDAVSMQLGN